ncbi:MAG: flap endonuclease [Solirubrobacterales bacterium]|nr:flap endonuclease [Solirubrobacterales bacterium]
MACDWLLIDGPSLIFRSYYASVRATAVRRVNTIQSFLERLERLIAQRGPAHVVVTEDWAWRPKWRVELIPSYKAHRADEPVPPALVPQLPVIAQLLTAIGIDHVGADDHEAEDVIATLAKLAPGTIEVASGDRDLFALVEDPRVRILYPEKSGWVVVDEAEVMRRYDVPGRRYADFAILRGDPSDGLPGLKGVGSVTAAAMIRRYGDIDAILRERTLRDSDRDYLIRAKRVVSPATDLPLALPPGRRSVYPADAEAVRGLAAEHQANGACQRLLATLGAERRTTTSAAASFRR